MIFFTSLFSSLQKIGKSLMLPVSVLPIAGILLGVGASNLSVFPPILSTIMEQAGASIFSNLPLLFAIGVSLGFTKNDGVAALSAVVGYVVLLATMGVLANTRGIETNLIMGINSIKTGVFSGIIIGSLSAYLFNKYYKIQLPSYLGFFAGKRFVPIITSFSAIILGIILSYIWPPIGEGIKAFSHWAANESPEIAFTLYGTVERALIPFGLHHIWNVPFFFEAGSYVDPKSAMTVTGELARYVSGDPTAGNLAGGYLFKMWGLPAAAIAIWHSAKQENKKQIAGIMISAALTSFITGITEPIEFAFIFVAPILYAVHALLAGLAFLVCILLEIKHGTTFSHGLIDYILLFGQSKNAIWLLVLGPLWSFIYYSFFRFAIHKFKLKTPGSELISSQTKDLKGLDKVAFAKLLIKALGGGNNILNLDSCITRLRIELKKTSLCQSQDLKELGASGVVIMGSGVQVIFGTKSGNLKSDMEEVLYSKDSEPTQQVALGFEQLISAFGGPSNITEVKKCTTSRIRIKVANEQLVDLSHNVAKTVASTGEGCYHLILRNDQDEVFHKIQTILKPIIA